MSRVVLVTGAAGVMGHRLVRGLAQTGWRVRALVLPNDPLRARVDPLDKAVVQVVQGDVQDVVSLQAAMEGVHTVFHLAAVILSPDPGVFERVNRQGTENVTRAAGAAGVQHLVYVSSASVTYPRLTKYAESKLAGEAIVKSETRVAHTIVRPTLVYDETGGQEFVLYRQNLLRFPVVPMIGRGDAKKRPVHSQDIVDGLVAIAGNLRAYGKTYNFSGGESISMRDFSQVILEHAGVHKAFVSVPVIFCKAAAVVLSAISTRSPLSLQAIAGIVNDADLSPDDAIRDLGYHPRGFREGMKQCFPLPTSVRQTKVTG